MVPMYEGEGEIARSAHFAEYQNLELASEAALLARTFADEQFIEHYAVPREGRDGWAGFWEANLSLRGILDEILGTFAMLEESETECRQTRKLAGSIEAILLGSFALESRTFPLPGDRSKFIIALSPLVCDLMADLAWAVPRALSERGPIFDPEKLKLIDDYIIRYLLAFIHHDRSVIRHIIDEVPRSPSTIRNAHSFRRASSRHLLLHEIGHLRLEHFDVLREMVMQGFFRPTSAIFPSRIVGREVAADCMAFQMNVNAHVHDILGRDAGDSFTQRVGQAVKCASLVSGYFFVVMEIFHHLAIVLGDSARAQRYAQACRRKKIVRRQVRYCRLSILPEFYGVRFWQLSDRTHWGLQKLFVDHVCRDLIPRAILYRPV
ncbi:hypothetical protein ACFW9X_21175 [Streptomyces sp. NPDC059466]|uniref:hypothetical protein n=1 Tax=Streptomyces sp. NPDC059466 TaxID=3346843 RepID=UPI0036BF6BED